MVKKLADLTTLELEKVVKSKSVDFDLYLHKRIPIKIQEFINDLTKKTEVLLFSGITRDYFLIHYRTIRDIDLVIIDDLPLEILFKDYLIRRNSFGGYKITIDNVSIDIWQLSKTWGIYSKFNPLNLNLDIDTNIQKQLLLQTVFFNFTAIIYSFNQKEFYASEAFYSFLKNKKIDIVLEDNPIPELCIINSFYYQDRYYLKLSKKLKKYIHNYSKKINYDKLKEIQIKHFGKIIYSEELIDLKLKSINARLTQR